MTEANDEDLFIRDDEPVTLRIAEPYGPFSMNGRLWFKMPNSSSISCNCIRDPFTTDIVNMLKEWKKHG